MCQDTCKVSKVFSSLFHIKWDITVMPLSSVGWAIRVSQILKYWGNLGKLDPNTPNHITCWDTWKESKVFSFLFHIKWDLTLVSRASVDWVIPVSQVLGCWGNLGKLGPNTPNHAQRHTKSNPKTSVPHLTSNEVLLLCQGQLRAQLYLSYGYLSI